MVVQWVYQNQMEILVIVTPKKKNNRTRCSALIKGQTQNILIDTSPDLRSQLLKNNIKKIDKVLYSHMHADQTHGINDLRIFLLKEKNHSCFC